jgi:hypothetical protein
MVERESFNCNGIYFSFVLSIVHCTLYIVHLDPSTELTTIVLYYSLLLIIRRHCDALYTLTTINVKIKPWHTAVGGCSIFLHARKSQGSGILRVQLKGTKLLNVEGMFAKSDPFFEISRKLDAAGGQTWDNVYRSGT